jgi:hypothetical protein
VGRRNLVEQHSMVRLGQLDRPGVVRPFLGGPELGRELGRRRLDWPQLGQRRLVLRQLALNP